MLSPSQIATVRYALTFLAANLGDEKPHLETAGGSACDLQTFIEDIDRAAQPVAA